jgi:hypothetical protein
MTALPKLFYGKVTSIVRSHRLPPSSARSTTNASFYRLNFLSAIPQHYEPATFWRLGTGYYRRNSSDYSLSEAFGDNAIQDMDSLVLLKADLELSGTCSPEQLLMALVQRWTSFQEAKEAKRIRAFLWRYQRLQKHERHIFAVQILVPSGGEVVRFSPHNISL